MKTTVVEMQNVGAIATGSFSDKGRISFHKST